MRKLFKLFFRVSTSRGLWLLGTVLNLIAAYGQNLTGNHELAGTLLNYAFLNVVLSFVAPWFRKFEEYL